MPVCKNVNVGGREYFVTSVILAGVTESILNGFESAITNMPFRLTWEVEEDYFVKTAGFNYLVQGVFRRGARKEENLVVVLYDVLAEGSLAVSSLDVGDPVDGSIICGSSQGVNNIELPGFELLSTQHGHLVAGDGEA